MAVSSPVPIQRSKISTLARRCLAPLGLFLGTLALYLATLTQVHTFDALSYVTSVERKPWTEVFHPHHLAYGPLGALALSIAQWLGFDGGAALPMQIVNATAGALGVALFFVVVRETVRRADLALIAALLLGGAYAYWYYAVEIEVYTVAAVFLLLCLWLLIRLLTQPSMQGFFLLGLAQGGAVLFHQTNVLLCAPAAVALAASAYMQPTCAMYARTDARPRAPWLAVRYGLAYGLPLALIVGGAYLFVGVIVSGFRSVEDFSAWLMDYARTGWWGGPITGQKWADLAAGWSDTLADPGGALLGLLLLGLFVLHVRSVLAHRRALVCVLAVWLLAYGAFFLWWEPDNIEFWIASLPPALLLLMLALRGERRWGAGVWVAMAVCITVLSVNYAEISRRGDPRTDLQRTIAAALNSHSQPADVLLLPDGLLELYLPYYEGHENYLSLNQAMFDSGADWDDACVMVRERIDTALHAGATAIIAEEVLRPPEALMQRHGLVQAHIDQCMAPYQSALQPLDMPPEAPAYWRLPTGQERAEGDGWHFVSWSQGWRAAHVVNSHIDAEGWRFVPEIDPFLTSPLLDLNAAQYQAIEIRLANTTLAYDAQLFYAGADGQISEERSVHWLLEPTTEAITYQIDLREAPGWQGTITRLRFDPVGVGDGGEMRVEFIRLTQAE